MILDRLKRLWKLSEQLPESPHDKAWNNYIETTTKPFGKFIPYKKLDVVDEFIKKQDE